MKKIIFILLIVLSTALFANAQLLVEPVYNDAGKFTGKYIGHFGPENGGRVVTWYLSYKNKRISDDFTVSYTVCYYNEFAKGMVHSTIGHYCWPNEVPAGHEKYVTGQIKKEETDPRDND